MSRIHFFCAAGLALVISALAAFYFGYRQGMWNGIRAATTSAASVQPVNLDSWKYPAMTVDSSQIGITGHVAGIIFNPQNFLKGTSPDQFDQVVSFYAQRCPESRVDVGLGAQHVDSSVIQSISIDDGVRAIGGFARPVRIMTFAVQTDTFDLFIMISRADTEAETHILLIQQ